MHVTFIEKITYFRLCQLAEEMNLETLNDDSGNVFAVCVKFLPCIVSYMYMSVHSHTLIELQWNLSLKCIQIHVIVLWIYCICRFFLRCLVYVKKENKNKKNKNIQCLWIIDNRFINERSISVKSILRYLKIVQIKKKTMIGYWISRWIAK